MTEQEAIQKLQKMSKKQVIEEYMRMNESHHDWMKHFYNKAKIAKKALRLAIELYHCGACIDTQSCKDCDTVDVIIKQLLEQAEKELKNG